MGNVLQASQRIGERASVLVVRDRDEGAVRREEAGGRDAALSDADHERFASREPHRYLSLIESSATSASMIETIQKRTMIFGSAQPCSSKW